MIQNIEIPKEIPFITLSDTVLFPHAIMPLFIFEPRYRKMLNDVLPADRIFGVATLDERTKETTVDEKCYPVAGIGVIRACKQNPDGNLNLILQGIARVRFESFISGEPYRKASVTQIVSNPGGTEQQIASMKTQMVHLIQTQRRLGANIPKEVFFLLNNFEDPERMLDLAISTLCSSTRLKLELLETSDVLVRFERFALFMEAEIQKLKLNRKLKGGLNDDEIANN